MFYKDLMLLNAILYQIKTIYAPQEGEQDSKRGQFDLFFCLNTTSTFVKRIFFVVATFPFLTLHFS
jgi:hypothetical protein